MKLKVPAERMMEIRDAVTFLFQEEARDLAIKHGCAGISTALNGDGDCEFVSRLAKDSNGNHYMFNCYACHEDDCPEGGYHWFSEMTPPSVTQEEAVEYFNCAVNFFVHQLKEECGLKMRDKEPVIINIKDTERNN